MPHFLPLYVIRDRQFTILLLMLQVSQNSKSGWDRDKLHVCTRFTIVKQALDGEKDGYSVLLSSFKFISNCSKAKSIVKSSDLSLSFSVAHGVLAEELCRWPDKWSLLIRYSCNSSLIILLYPLQMNSKCQAYCSVAFRIHFVTLHVVWFQLCSFPNSWNFHFLVLSIECFKTLDQIFTSSL